MNYDTSLKEFTRLFRIPQFCNDQILAFPLSSHLFCFQLLYSAMIRGTSPLIWLKLLDPSNINSCISTFQPLILLQLLYSAMIRGTSPLIWLKLLDPPNINSCISTFQPLVLLPTSLQWIKNISICCLTKREVNPKT